jgi:ABC-2 type transport system ATP-binding protein
LSPPKEHAAPIETTGLTKRYGEIAALTDLSLTVPPGVVYGFLGPNGAGKTTAIRLLLGFIRPTGGRARLRGHDCWRDGVAARNDLGFLVVPDAFYPDMSGAAQLDYLARLSGRPPLLRERFREALELGRDALERRLGSYSKGMRQKLALIAAFQHDPSLLILDEPTDGLDPLIQRSFEELLRDLRDRGRTIFMSSHDLAEVERTCERVAVVRDGRLVVEETVAELKGHARRIAEVTFRDEVPAEIATVPRAVVFERDGRRVRLAIEGDVNPLLRVLAQHDVAELTLAPPRLEDVFMAFYAEGDEGGFAGGRGGRGEEIVSSPSPPSAPLVPLDLVRR